MRGRADMRTPHPPMGGRLNKQPPRRYRPIEPTLVLLDVQLFWRADPLEVGPDTLTSLISALGLTGEVA